MFLGESLSQKVFNALKHAELGWLLIINEHKLIIWLTGIAWKKCFVKVKKVIILWFLIADSSFFTRLFSSFFFCFGTAMYHESLINFAKREKKKQKKNKSLKALDWLGIESYCARHRKTYVWKLHKKAVKLNIWRFFCKTWKRERFTRGVIKRSSKSRRGKRRKKGTKK